MHNVSDYLVSPRKRYWMQVKTIRFKLPFERPLPKTPNRQRPRTRATPRTSTKRKKKKRQTGSIRNQIVGRGIHRRSVKCSPKKRTSKRIRKSPPNLPRRSQRSMTTMTGSGISALKRIPARPLSSVFQMALKSRRRSLALLPWRYASAVMLFSFLVTLQKCQPLRLARKSRLVMVF